MKWLFSFLIASFFLLSTLQTPSVVSAYTLATNRLSIQSSDSMPNILYAEWIGKNLQIEGTGFANGAKVFVDGQSLKTSNNENYPNNFLHAKKAKKKVAPNQAIKLQVQNPDGEMSNEFTFYSGFIITSSYHGSSIHLKIGDSFLLFLPSKGEPPTLGWSTSLYGADQTMLVRTMENLPIPHTQGFFQAVRQGQVIVNAQGSALCPPLPSEYCGPRGIFYGFDVGVIVE